MTASLLKIALPSILQALFEWSRPLVLLHYVAGVGGNSADISASAGLALTLFNCAVSYPTYGFGSAFDTLTSQAFGSERRDLVAVDLCIVSIVALVSTGITLVFLLLVMVYVSPLIGPSGGAVLNKFLYILLWNIPATVVWNLLTRWLRAQHLSGAIVAGVTLGATLNVVLNVSPWSSLQSLADPMAMPFVVLSISNVVMLIPILIQACLAWLNLGSGWKCEDLVNCQRLRSVASLGVKGILLTCGEIWCWEIQILFCSWLGPVSIAAYAICFNFYSFLVMVPVGLRTGLSVIVGFHIGRGNSSDADAALRQSLYYLFAVVVLYFVGLMFFGQQIADLFSTSPLVTGLIVKSLRVIALYQAFDGLYNVLGGALSGVGKQGEAAKATLAFYFVGIPAALLCAFQLHGGAAGLWAGMGIANILVCLFVLLRVRELDFVEEVKATNFAPLSLVESSR